LRTEFRIREPGFRSWDLELGSSNSCARIVGCICIVHDKLSLAFIFIDIAGCTFIF